jgi:uncharacterized LabA/DUF88 family protein
MNDTMTAPARVPATKVNPFNLREADRTAAFIDGPGLYWAFKNASGDERMDFMRLRAHIADNSDAMGFGYYTVFPPLAPGQGDSQKLRPLVDFLGYNGFRVETKDARSYETDMGTRIKGSIAVDLALDAMLSAVNGMNHALLFLNDEDYAPLIVRLQDRGCKVTVVSTKVRNIVSNDLLYGLDHFIELTDVKRYLLRRE